MNAFAGISTSAGVIHSIRSRSAGVSAKRMALYGGLGAGACFYGGTKLEYLNLLRNREVKTFSPGGICYLGGFYSLGALLSSVVLETLSRSNFPIGHLPISAPI